MSDAMDVATVGEDLRRLRGQVRADRRATSAPLFVFGLLIVGSAVALMAAAPLGPGLRHLTALTYWPVAGAVGLLALWSHARRLSVRAGVGEGRRSYRPVALGYLVSVPVIAVLFIPLLFVGVFAPLLWPAAVLAAIAVRQRNHALGGVAGAIATLGVAEATLLLGGASNDGAWAETAVNVTLGLGLAAIAVLLTRHRPAA